MQVQDDKTLRIVSLALDRNDETTLEAIGARIAALQGSPIQPSLESTVQEVVNWAMANVGPAIDAQERAKAHAEQDAEAQAEAQVEQVEQAEQEGEEDLPLAEDVERQKREGVVPLHE